MKRIAFVSTNDMTPWSGSEELWAQTAISMAQQGFTVGVNIKGWKPTPKKFRHWSERIVVLSADGMTAIASKS